MKMYSKLPRLLTLFSLAIGSGFLTDVRADIPVPHLKGVDKRFSPEFKQYSPLRGALGRNNNFITNIYTYGDEADAAAKLVKSIFNKVSEGEIITSGLAKNPGSQMGPETIAKIFTKFQEFKVNSSKKKSTLTGDDLAKDLEAAIASSADYQENFKKSLELFNKSKATLAALELEFKVAQEKRALQEQEEEKIKKATKLVKVLKDSLKMVEKKKDMEKAERIRGDVAKAEENLAELKKASEVPQVPMLTNKDFQISRRRLEYETKRYDVTTEEYSAALKSLAKTMADSFMKHDLKDMGPNEFYPHSTTADILLSYLWAKANKKSDLKPYMDEMKKLGALKTETYFKKYPLDEAFYNDFYTKEDWAQIKKDFTLREPSESMTDWFAIDYKNIDLEKLRVKLFEIHKNPDWIYRNFANAAAIKMEKPANTGTAPVIPFKVFSGYNGWKFPDCGENAVRAILNLAVYNKEKAIMDYTILERLRDEKGLKIRQSVIDFFKKYPDPMATKDEHYSAWMEIVSDLNKGREHVDKSERVEYKWGRSASNPSGSGELNGGERAWINAVKILLGGITPKDLIKTVNEMTNSKIEYDDSAVDGQGIGNLFITDGNSKYRFRFMAMHYIVDMEKSKNNAENFGESIETVIKKMDGHNIGKLNAKNKQVALKANSLLSLDLTDQLETLGKKGLPSHWRFYVKNICDNTLYKNFSLSIDGKKSTPEEVKWNIKVFKEMKDIEQKKKILQMLKDAKMEEEYKELFEMNLIPNGEKDGKESSSVHSTTEKVTAEKQLPIIRSFNEI